MARVEVCGENRAIELHAILTYTKGRLGIMNWIVKSAADETRCEEKGGEPYRGLPSILAGVTWE